MFKALVPMWIAFGSILSGCPLKGDKEVRKSMEIERAGDLEDIPESSGLIMLNDSTLLTHSDSGNPASVFQLSATDFKTEKVHELALPNRDWEDIARDNEGNIYIGDIGNNGNNRKDLKIYRLNANFELTQTISFQYPDQDAFPPDNKDDWNYDCEAFFWLDDRLYLFSKNIRWPYTKVYSLDPSTNDIQLIDSLALSSPITAADVREDGKEAVLLTYGKVFFVDIIRDENLRFRPSVCKKFGKSGQAEGIAYLNDNEIILSNEKGKIFVLKR